MGRTASVRAYSYVPVAAAAAAVIALIALFAAQPCSLLCLVCVCSVSLPVVAVPIADLQAFDPDSRAVTNGNPSAVVDGNALTYWDPSPTPPGPVRLFIRIV